MIADDTIRALPKAVLHDHLDGGLRPATVIELAQEYGYHNLAVFREGFEGWKGAGLPVEPGP